MKYHRNAWICITHKCIYSHYILHEFGIIFHRRLFTKFHCFGDFRAVWPTYIFNWRFQIKFTNRDASFLLISSINHRLLIVTVVQVKIREIQSKSWEIVENAQRCYGAQRSFCLLPRELTVSMMTYGRSDSRTT